MSERVARCGCGQLTITVSGEPGMIAMCNCVECQRRSGSQFGSGAFFERANVTIEGEYKNFQPSRRQRQEADQLFLPALRQQHRLGSRNTAGLDRGRRRRLRRSEFSAADSSAL